MKDPGKWSGSIDYRNIIGTKEGTTMEGIISRYQAER